MRLRAGALTIFLIFSLETTDALSQSTREKASKTEGRLEYETELQRLKRNEPKEYEDTTRMVILGTQLLLGRLGYGIGPYDGVLDEKTKSAVREYQKQRKLPITGDPLSFETFDQVNKDTNLVNYEPVTLPNLFVSLDFWQSGYVSGKGTWVLTNEKMGWPEQTTHIQCVRDRRICIEATALLTGSGGKKTVGVDADLYDIERWDDHEIVTKPKETPASCVRYMRRFNRLQKSVTGLRSTISTEGLCKGVETKEMHMILSDGFKVYRELSQTSNEKVRQLMRYAPQVIEALK
jgi:hypothetical protein